MPRVGEFRPEPTERTRRGSHLGSANKTCLQDAERGEESNLMAKLEELAAKIADPTLRDAILREVHALKKSKKFGLVFEEHLPEIILMPNLPVRRGETVVERDAKKGPQYRVVAVQGEEVTVKDTKTDKEFRFARHEIVVVKSFGEAIYPTLVPVEKLARGGDKPWHVLIEADNFHALQLLLYTHKGKVDCIYIDPPYNSGARDWKYNNNYVDLADSFRHSKWLSMMKKRLLLAKRLLKSDGVLVVTIDENEATRLALLIEEVFPEYLLQTVTVVINPKGTGKLNFARVDEYALFCVPNTGESIITGTRVSQVNKTLIEDVETNLAEKPADDLFGETNGGDSVDDEEPADAEEIEWDFPFPENEKGLWERRHARRRGNESSYRHQRPNQFYPIYINESERKVVRAGESLPLDQSPSFQRVDGLIPQWPIDAEGNERCWRVTPSSMQAIINDERLVLGKSRTVHGRKDWTLNIWVRKPSHKKLKTVWWSTTHDAGTHGTSVLHKILGRRDAFPFPKSIYAVRDALAAVCAERPNAVIVDFFAGSGTTYQATCMLNAEDGGKRRCIMVSYNEVSEKTAKTLRARELRPGDKAYEENGICQSVTWPRCKAVTTGKREDGKRIDLTYAEGTALQGRAFSLGFEENVEYFKLDFLDPSQVSLGHAFESVLPVLWLMAGAVGERPEARKRKPYLLPTAAPFGILLREDHFADFALALADRTDVTHVFLVTDSQDAFRSMSGALPKHLHKVMLYRSYLENFRINYPNFAP